MNLRATRLFYREINRRRIKINNNKALEDFFQGSGKIFPMINYFLSAATFCCSKQSLAYSINLVS